MVAFSWQAEGTEHNLYQSIFLVNFSDKGDRNTGEWEDGVTGSQ
jgi:hypothetical protein